MYADRSNDTDDMGLGDIFAEGDHVMQALGGNPSRMALMHEPSTAGNFQSSRFALANGAPSRPFDNNMPGRAMPGAPFGFTGHGVGGSSASSSMAPSSFPTVASSGRMCSGATRVSEEVKACITDGLARGNYDAAISKVRLSALVHSHVVAKGID